MKRERFTIAERTFMKLFLVSIALLGIALSSAAEAKGCIKGAIVGGLAGHMPPTKTTSIHFIKRPRCKGRATKDQCRKDGPCDPAKYPVPLT